LSRSPYAIGVLGLAFIAVWVWRLRVPAGLELTPAGVRGVRGSARIDWSWDDLVQVGVVGAPVAKLSLTPRGGVGRPVLAPTLALGSDPNEVAAIVRYYLERPAERGALADGGVAAVRRVEDALSARTA
ncbi:MAG: murein endopeptidase, partial [Microbacterium sp.]|nr:murein endopeptidase [Microbacterium sp.]